MLEHIIGSKRTADEFRTERQRFQILSENVPLGIMMIDKKGIFTSINPKFRELFGYDLKDIPNGREWFRKAYPDPAYRHQVISAWTDDLKSAKPGEKRARNFTVTCTGKLTWITILSHHVPMDGFNCGKMGSWDAPFPSDAQSLPSFF